MPLALSEHLLWRTSGYFKKKFWSSTTSCSSMDEYTEKRPAGVFEFSNESSGLSFRDPKHEGRNFNFNGTECSTGHGSTKSTQNSNPGKIKYLKPPLLFKSSNPYTASSTMNLSFHESQKREYLEETNNTEGSDKEDEEDDVLKFDFGVHGRKKKEIDFSRGLKTAYLHSSPTTSTKISNNSEATSSSRYGKQSSQNTGCAIQDSVTPPKIASQMPKSIPQVSVGRPQRYGLKSLGYASISDALPSGSSSDGHNKRAVQLRKKFHHGEGSSTGISLRQEHQVPAGTSRRTKDKHNIRDVTVFGKTCPNVGSKSSGMRSNEPEDEHSFQLPESCLFPTQPHASLTIPEVVQERSQLPPVSQNTSFAGTPWSSSRSSRRRSVSRSEVRDDYVRLNMEGIAEVLHALERIEQDEGLAYEQLMILEDNLLEGFGFYDQHRGMRMDIDSMSYEDLLALEEKIGSVSTAVPEDSLSKCLKKSTYRASFLHMRGVSGHGDDDIKCSICQEEYVNGEEVGRLPCDHQYHMACIQQWLRLKNWCPICKVPPFLS